MSSGSGGGGTNTVTQSTQIPQFEQDFAQSNQQLAQSLGQQPYPTYQGALVQGFAPQQYQGMGMAQNAASAYQPDLSAAEGITQGASSPNVYAQEGLGILPNTNLTGNQWAQSGFNALGGATSSALQGGAGAGLGTLMGATQMGPNNQTIAQYMSPYVQQSLAPQVTALQTQLGQQQNAINAQATQDNAFGDARQGAAQALQNFYGNQALSGVEAQGYNTAYSNALQTALGEQQTQGQLGQALGSLGMNLGQLQLGQGQAQGNLGLGINASGLAQGQALANAGLGLQQEQLAAGNQLANLGGLNQSLGITGANALFNTGQQQQQLGQQELNQAYQQYLNQVNWPFQMLNVQESALSNSPYNMVNATTLPQANMTAQGFGAGVGALGSLASLFGGGGNNAPFGGSAFPSGAA